MFDSFESDSNFSTGSLFIDSGQDSNLEVELNAANFTKNQTEETRVEHKDSNQIEE